MDEIKPQSKDELVVAVVVVVVAGPLLGESVNPPLLAVDAERRSSEDVAFPALRWRAESGARVASSVPGERSWLCQ